MAIHFGKSCDSFGHMLDDSYDSRYSARWWLLVMVLFDESYDSYFANVSFFSDRSRNTSPHRYKWIGNYYARPYEAQFI